MTAYCGFAGGCGRYCCLAVSGIREGVLSYDPFVFIGFTPGMAHVARYFCTVGTVRLLFIRRWRDGIALDIPGCISHDAVHQNGRCGKMDTESLFVFKQEVFGKVLPRRGWPWLIIVYRIFLKFFLYKFCGFLH